MKELVLVINKKKVGLRFTNLTLEFLLEELKTDFSGMLDSVEKNPMAMINSLIMCANKVYTKGDEPSKYEVDEWIQLMSDEDLKEIFNMFKNSMTDLTRIFSGAQEEKEAGKKK